MSGQGHAPCPAAAALVANRLAELAGQRATVTLTSRLSAIAQAHHLLRLPFNPRDPNRAGRAWHRPRPRHNRPSARPAVLIADVIKLAGGLRW